MQKLSVGDCIRFGWATFKKRPWMLIGGFALAFIVSAVVSALLDPGENAPLTLTTFVMGLGSFVIGLFIELGLLTFAVRAHDSVETVEIRSLWNPAPFWRYLASQLMVGIAVIIGLILLIVPGVILALGFLFSAYLVIDKGRGPIEAIKESWRITKGHKWQLFLLVLAVAGINVIGFLLLLVGLIVTIPVTMLAVVHAYRTLEHRASEVTPVPTA